MLLVASRREAPIVARAAVERRALRVAGDRAALPEPRLARRRARSRPSRISCSSRAGLGRSSSAPRARAPGAARPRSRSSTSIRRSGAGTASCTPSAQARNAVLLTAVAGLVVGAARRSGRSAHGRSRGSAAPPRRVVFALAGLAALAGVVAAGPHVPPPGAAAAQAWHDFKVTKPATQTSYFANWPRREPLRRLARRDRRVQGQADPRRRRRQLRSRLPAASGAARRSPSIRTASSCACSRRPGSSAPSSSSASWGARRVASPLYRLPVSKQAVAGTALTMAVYWFVHGSVDWFWEIPALGGVAFMCLGIATSLTCRAAAAVRISAAACATLLDRRPRGRRSGCRRRATRCRGSPRRRRVRAATSWRQDPRRRYARLRHRGAAEPALRRAEGRRRRDRQSPQRPRADAVGVHRGVEARSTRLVRAPRAGRRRLSSRAGATWRSASSPRRTGSIRSSP